MIGGLTDNPHRYHMGNCQTINYGMKYGMKLLDLTILGVFSNLNDSMILNLAHKRALLQAK